MKTIHTLVEDIYALFDPDVHHEVNEDVVEEFGETLKEILRTRLAGRGPEDRTHLRFSNLGKPDRQVWYAIKGAPKEKMHPKTYFKFLYGDVIEALIIFLAKEAGHDVTDLQREVDVDGVKGHIDCIIDGVVVDVKSASPFSYKKFEDISKLLEDDPFGYIQQISGYNNVLTPNQGPAFLAFDKVSGDICVAPVSRSIAKCHPPAERIAHLREVIASDDPPPRCYEDKPDGKSGNRALGTGCSYCDYKFRCWSDANGGRGLRTFLYAGKPRYMTNVARAPSEHIMEVNWDPEAADAGA